MLHTPWQRKTLPHHALLTAGTKQLRFSSRRRPAARPPAAAARPPVAMSGSTDAPPPTATTTKFKKVAVFCGASTGGPAYAAAARALGEELVRRGVGLVYGGGNVGLMGVVAETVAAAGLPVVGVIPAALAPREISGTTCGEIRMVDNMHQRKAMMFDEADAFVTLPGGYGTLDETLEITTWNQLGFHTKPVGPGDGGGGGGCGGGVRVRGAARGSACALHCMARAPPTHPHADAHFTRAPAALPRPPHPGGHPQRVWLFRLAAGVS